MQSLDVVPTRHFDDVMEMVRTLKEEKYTLVVMETTSKSMKYTTKGLYSHVEQTTEHGSDTTSNSHGSGSNGAIQPKKIALVCGNEITGVDTRIMDVCDLMVEIPTFGVKNSLNVASAVPIVLFEVLRQFQAIEGGESERVRVE